MGAGHVHVIDPGVSERETSNVRTDTRYVRLPDDRLYEKKENAYLYDSTDYATR